jgi:hypothetical protein
LKQAFPGHVTCGLRISENNLLNQKNIMVPIQIRMTETLAALGAYFSFSEDGKTMDGRENTPLVGPGFRLSTP